MDNKNFNQLTSENSQISPLTAILKSKRKLLIISAVLVITGIVTLSSSLSFSFFNKNRSKQSAIKLVNTKPIVTINSPIKTEFAEYKPYNVNITPAANSYNLPVNWNKIENKKKFSYLNNKIKQKLISQGFVAMPTYYYDEIYDLYKDNTEKNKPNFVTTDSVLHTFHILFDYTLRNLEINKFMPALKNLNKALLQSAFNQYNSVTNPQLKSSLKKVVAYFAVASKLLDPKTEIPSDVKDIVEKELNLIENHFGLKNSAIFGYKEDYSQYIPRGHYTRNEDFKKYFKTMMWYGRMMFRLKNKEETKQALLISLILNQTKVNQEDALKVWEKIYQPTVFFVGKTDDLNVYDYLKAMKKVFGENLSINSLADESKIEKIINELKALPSPKISSSFVLETEDAAEETKGFRFMGQRFIPDSYIFQQLVFKNVEDYIGKDPKPFTAETVETEDGVRTIRVFPRGLDVAAVLGSKRAKEILDKEKDSVFKNYNQQFQKLQKEFSSLPQNQWAESLYWNWLYSLLPLLTVKGNGYPIFMQQVSWLDKDLNSFLGSWAELRHDTILYAKQSYGDAIIVSIDQPRPKPEDRGYVEPNVEVYARLTSLAKFMREGLESRNLLNEDYKNKLIEMEKVLLTLKAISEKELANKNLDKNDYEFIKEIGNILENLVTFSAAETRSITSETDTKMEIIADVHTDSNTGQVLEEGIGKPMELLVVVKEGGDLYLTSGAIFSYYEFKHPMSDRLTDEKWQQMPKPSLPNFIQSFTIK